MFVVWLWVEDPRGKAERHRRRGRDSHRRGLKAELHAATAAGALILDLIGLDLDRFSHI